MDDDRADLDELRRRVVHVPFLSLVKHLRRVLPGATPVGGVGPSSGESIRFVHDIRPIFHASDVSALRLLRQGDEVVAEITTAFLGLVGSVSPLPESFTDEVLQAGGNDDATLRDFYDVLHHRLIALHFRGMLRSSPAAELLVSGVDRATARSTAASGAAAFAPTLQSTSRDWLGGARVFGRRPRTRPALEEALAIALPQLSFQLDDFVPCSASFAGARPRVGMGELRLRHGAHVGRHAHTYASGVRLRVGPVSGDQFRALLPGGRDFEALSAVVESTLGGRSNAQLEIEVARGEEPRARVGKRYGTRLRRGALVLRKGRRCGVRARVALTGGQAGRVVFLVS